MNKNELKNVDEKKASLSGIGIQKTNTCTYIYPI